MASKTALNAKNLKAPGAPRLAELMMELSRGDGAAQRRLRLELAGVQGAGEVARAIRRRLGQVARARGYLDWYSRRPVIDDLDAHRRAVVKRVAPQGPTEAPRPWGRNASGEGSFRGEHPERAGKAAAGGPPSAGNVRCRGRRLAWRPRAPAWGHDAPGQSLSGVKPAAPGAARSVGGSR